MIHTEPTLSTSAPAVCRRPIELCPVGACQPCDTSRRHAGSDATDPEALQAALVHRCESVSEEEAQRILGGPPDTMLSTEWTDNGKLYRVSSSEVNGMPLVRLEVQHVPGESQWVGNAPSPELTSDATVLIPRLRYLAPGLHGTTSWTFQGGRGGVTRTLARLTDSADSYETSYDDGARWHTEDHPYALALRVLELDPA